MNENQANHRREQKQYNPLYPTSLASFKHRNMAAQHLRQNKHIVKELWERHVREQISESEDKTSLALQNSLDIFLDQVCSLLEKKDALPEILSVGGMSKIHGEQRTTLKGYLLPQILKEFSLLREVISELLYTAGILTYDTHKFIDKTIDSAISISATEFTRVKQLDIYLALKKAEVSNKDLEHFAAIAAHDLKSPLAVISSSLDLLGLEFKAELGKKALEYMKMMHKSSERMRDLIDRLLDYSRLTDSHKKFRQTDMNAVLDAACENLASTLKNSNGKITHSMLPEIVGDPDLLVRVFQNLIANALKFRGKNDPEIEVTAIEKDEVFVFSVKDNGIGIKSSETENIFDLYKKLHTNSQYEGFGIGLAACRKIIDLHGGTIWAESLPPIGSIFHFTIPKIAAKTSFHSLN